MIHDSCCVLTELLFSNRESSAVQPGCEHCTCLGAVLFSKNIYSLWQVSSLDGFKAQNVSAHPGSYTGCQCLSTGRLVLSFGADWSLSRAIEWIALKFCADIHGLRKMNHTYLADPLTFPLQLLADRFLFYWNVSINGCIAHFFCQDIQSAQCLHLSCEISQHTHKKHSQSPYLHRFNIVHSLGP